MSNITKIQYTCKIWQPKTLELESELVYGPALALLELEQALLRPELAFLRPELALLRPEPALLRLKLAFKS